MNHDNFESLVWKFLDQEMSDDEFAEFQALLTEDPALRKRYQHLVDLHQAIMQRADQGDTAIAPAPSKITPIRRSKWKWVAAVAMAACVAISAVLIFTPKQPTLEVEYVALRNADIRGKSIEQGDKATTRMVHLAHGAVALRFPGKTEAVIEGPAWYQVQDNKSVVLSSGTITVHHEGKPGNFRVITPLGDLTDMGTKFGVSVGDGIDDSMVMTEVYEGEVIYSNAKNSRHSITEGQGLAIVGSHDAHNILSDINGEKVKVSGGFRLSQVDEELKSKKNLALGKPATAKATYHSRGSGETFGAHALTDGRLFDTGSPFNWSFWLAPDGDSGCATVDLLEEHTISRVELQNTRNRHHHDRGIKDFVIELSTDGKTFTEVTRGTLKWVDSMKVESFHMESFKFEPTKARYVRVRGLSHYLDPKKRHGGCGGLNEIRVFE